MKLNDLFDLVENLPVIDTESLLVGVDNPASLRVQISRWKRLGRIIQLKRGLYILSDRYRKLELFEPYVASLLKEPSYISLEKALEYHDMIPEAVKVYTSVTTKRPGRFNTKIGIFDYRHIRESLFWGYVSVTLNKQTAFMATPEKALLDLFYLRDIEASGHYLQELRLQNIEKIDEKTLFQFAGRFQKPKMVRTAAEIMRYAAACGRGEKSL